MLPHLGGILVSKRLSSQPFCHSLILLPTTDVEGLFSGLHDCLLVLLGCGEPVASRDSLRPWPLFFYGRGICWGGKVHVLLNPLRPPPSVKLGDARP